MAGNPAGKADAAEAAASAKAASAAEAGAAALVTGAVGVIGTVISELGKIPATVRPFVDAFNPATGQKFDESIERVNAVIGNALEPILQAAITVVDQFGGAIGAAMDALRGPIEAVASLFIGTLQPVIATVGLVVETLVGNFTALQSVLRPLFSILEAYFNYLRVLITIFIAVRNVVFQILLEPLKAFGNLLGRAADMLVEFTIGLLTAVDFLLRLLGADKVANEILLSLTKKRPDKADDKRAPKDFGVTGLEDLYRRRMVAAAQAKAPGLEEQNNKYLERIAEAAEELLQDAKAKGKGPPVVRIDDARPRPAPDAGERQKDRNENV